MVGQGLLTKDQNLINDLCNKIDFHCKRVAIQPKYKITYDEVLSIINDEDHPEHSKWKKRRTHAKIFSFQRAYGAGVSLIALSTGMSEDDVRELIQAEEKTYPKVVQFYDNVESEVTLNAKAFRDPSHDMKVFRRGVWVAPTGCRYTFRSWPAKEWQVQKGILEALSPTEMKNYPIQGTSGEIVQGICGKLWRHFVSNNNYENKAVLCNTVHDCVWVDADSSVAHDVAKDVKEIIESVPAWLSQFDIDCPVPFPVEVEMGRNMLDLKHVH